MRFNTFSYLILCGRKRSGKSTYLKALMRKIDRFLLFDYHYEHQQLGQTTQVLENIPVLWAKGLRRIVYLPQRRSEEELERFCEIAKNITNLVLIVEECDRVSSKHGLAPHFADVVHTGSNHYGLGLITMTRRFANLHSDIISQADWVVFFKQHSKNDIGRLKEELSEEAENIKQIEPHGYGEFDANTGEISWYRPLAPWQIKA